MSLVLPFSILVLSTALFFFYIHSVCARVLRREFGQPYCEDINKAIQLEYPHVRDEFASGTSFDYSHVRTALKCDFEVLKFLLKNGDRTPLRLSRHEKILFLYFRFLLFYLSIRHDLKLQERDVILKLAAVLQYLANSFGESLSLVSGANAFPTLTS